ncbi:translocation/assembly module TamB domain-containing protein [Maribacter sp. BPC-D8]|uniref:translocation/assembly module TamB domain-containing protein n=1 Tax=Maribacter sp. BPC-D8 TaxID=3053613 RepID=UPI002B463336|nr:translocation/assembly module TamB domain-containing protein [Maribacter sp. BPC-D8]WRI28245.1 translocation/assembly module TamB domain-containing protein [Maribacter sp. BPC-D8]
MILVVRTPWAQNFIVTKVTNYIADKTNTKVAVGKLYLTFSGDIQVENVFLEDKKGDTLFYSKSLQADIPIYPIVFKNSLSIDDVTSNGVVANISRDDNPDEFNFTFLIDALTTPTDSTAPASEAMNIDVGNLDLTDWKLKYNDTYLGTDINLLLGKLDVAVSEFDLEKMKFSLDELNLNNTQFTYNQTHPFPVTEDTTSTALPFIKVEDFKVENVAVNYNSQPDGLQTQLKLGTIELTDILADVSKNRYETDDLLFQDSQIAIQIKSEEVVQDDTTENSAFEWPEFIIAANDINIAKNTFSYSLNGNVSNSDTFNPDAFKIQNFELLAKNLTYQPEKFNADVSKFSFSEPSGIRLNQLAFKVGLSDTEASLQDLVFHMNQSSANANLAIQFNSLKGAIKNPEKTNLSAEISNLNLELEDVLKLLPELAQNQYLDSLAAKPITGNLKAIGSLDKVNDFNTNLQWGKDTKLTAKGSISNLTNIDSLTYNLNNISLNSTKSAIDKIISSKELGISIPETILAAGNLSGGTTWVKPDINIKIPEGSATINALVNFDDTMKFNGQISVDSLQLGKLLQNDQLGEISLNVKGNGSGTEVGNIDATINGNISQFNYGGYDYKEVVINGILKDGNGNITANINDPNLNMKANATMALSSQENDITFTSNIIGADLQQLAITKQNIKIAANIIGDYKGSPSNFTINTTIEDGITIANNKQYQISTIALKAHIEDSITDVSIQSNFLNGLLASNASPNRINAALKKQLEHYFSTDDTTFEAEDDIDAKLSLAIIPTPVLSKVFFNGVKDLDSVNIDASFNSKKRKISAEVKVPHIAYAGSSVDSLNAYIKGDSVDLKFSAGLADLIYEPIHLKQTYLEGSLKNKELQLDFTSKNDTVQVMHIGSGLTFERDTIKLHIDPENLILNKKQWEIPEENNIVIADAYSDFENVVLTRNAQKLEISNKFPKIKREHIAVLFEHFQLQTFLSFFNPDEALASGKVEGDLVILNPYTASGLVANINIKDFQVLQNSLGTLTLDASSKSLSEYDFDLAMKDGGANLTLTGDYTSKENTAYLNMELDIQKLQASILQGFSNEQLTNAKGYLDGSLLVKGSLAEPKYSGRINFNEFGLSLNAYKSAFTIDNQSIDIDQNDITFNSFTISDINQSTLTVDGNIITESFANPGFDLSVKTDQFRVLDSKRGDDELVYGTASIQADVTVKGDLKLPVIDGKLRVRDVTDLTYIVPQDQLDIQERDGVVIFVNRENPDAIRTRSDEEATNSFFAGMDINTILEIGDEAKFTIVLDEKTQDKLQASGSATLNLNIDPNQDIRLSGRLELTSGFYRTSLYNLVSREFQLQKGSSIIWSGDPYDAKMDVTAIYEIETSASSLMSSISYGSDSSVSGTYQQAADFLVYLNIDGQLTQPEISFALDMPESEQGNNGGAVYSRVQQLNEQESELNKQVFSLLVLNRFYPTSGSDGSSGGAISIAKNNVNKVLSNELTSISSKLLGNTGFELGFDLDSFEDYESGTAESRTQLNISASKKLFNDRLIVTAGSAVDVEGSASSSETETPLIGNVTLEYLLNEKGTYRLKGFRKQEYQNIIDGQLIITGIAFIFNREFNKFSQLFNPLRKKHSNKEGSKKDKKEEDIEK